MHELPCSHGYVLWWSRWGCFFFKFSENNAETIPENIILIDQIFNPSIKICTLQWYHSKTYDSVRSDCLPHECRYYISSSYHAGRSSLNFLHGFSRQPTHNLAETDLRPIKGIPTYLVLNSTDLNIPGRINRVELIDLKGTLWMNNIRKMFMI